jgi:hypothetical protein
MIDTTEDNVVVLFKTFEELQRDERQIVADLDGDLDEILRRCELAIIGLEGDSTELAKLGGADQQLAKSAATRLLFENHNCDTAARMQAHNECLRAAIEARKKADKLMHGHGALCRRSARRAAAVARK